MTEATHRSISPAVADTFTFTTTRRDEWAACRDRAASILRAPALLLPWLFGLAFGIGYAVITKETAGWALAGVLVALMLVAVGADNIKFWVVLYPFIFLAPQSTLGAWEESGEKLFGLQLYEPWIFLMLCLWVPRTLAAKRLELPWSMKGPLGVLLVLGLLAIWIAPDRLLAIKIGVRTLFEPLLLFLMITSLPWKRAELRWAVCILLCVATPVAGISILGYSTGQGDSAHGLTRLHSYWEGTNVQAAFLGVIIPVALGWALSASSRTTVMTGVASLLAAFVALVLTYTRGAWIGVGVGIGIISMIGRLQARIWAVVVALLILLGVLAGPPELLERAQSIIHFEYDRSASHRLILWPKVIDLIADRPLTGYGFGGFQPLRKQAGIRDIHAHNVFLDFAITLGVPALILFLWFVGYTLIRAFATIRQSPRSETFLLLGVWAGSISLLAAGVVDGSILIWSILAHTFWFILALTYALTVAGDRNLHLSRRSARYAKEPVS